MVERRVTMSYGAFKILSRGKPLVFAPQESNLKKFLLMGARSGGKAPAPLPPVITEAVISAVPVVGVGKGVYRAGLGTYKLGRAIINLPRTAGQFVVGTVGGILAVKLGAGILRSQTGQRFIKESILNIPQTGKGVAGAIDRPVPTIKGFISELTGKFEGLDERVKYAGLGGLGTAGLLGTGVIIKNLLTKEREVITSFTDITPPSISGGEIPTVTPSVISPLEEEKPAVVSPISQKPIKFKNVVNVNVYNRRTNKYINPIAISL